MGSHGDHADSLTKEKDGFMKLDPSMQRSDVQSFMKNWEPLFDADEHDWCQTVSSSSLDHE